MRFPSGLRVQLRLRLRRRVGRARKFLDTPAYRHRTNSSPTESVRDSRGNARGATRLHSPVPVHAIPNRDDAVLTMAPTVRSGPAVRDDPARSIQYNVGRGK